MKHRRNRLIKQADEFTGVASPKLAFFLFCAGAVGLAKSDRCMENVEWKTEGGGKQVTDFTNIYRQARGKSEIEGCMEA